MIYDKGPIEKPLQFKGRDFVKEAKGKTFSLIVAALCHNHKLSPENILKTADLLLKGIEDREYF